MPPGLSGLLLSEYEYQAPYPTSAETKATDALLKYIDDWRGSPSGKGLGSFLDGDDDLGEDDERNRRVAAGDRNEDNVVFNGDDDDDGKRREVELLRLVLRRPRTVH